MNGDTPQTVVKADAPSLAVKFTLVRGKTGVVSISCHVRDFLFFIFKAELESKHLGNISHISTSTNLANYVNAGTPLEFLLQRILFLLVFLCCSSRKGAPGCCCLLNCSPLQKKQFSMMNHDILCWLPILCFVENNF